MTERFQTGVVRHDAPLRAIVRPLTRHGPMTAMIGRTIGKYRIVGQLGRGGAGIVYKAVDETLGRDVAVKTLNPDLGNTEVMNRFRAEATILAKLNHPQIATIFELFREENDLLMVMEFVRGETVHDLCDRLGTLAPPQAAHVAVQVLDALSHAHRAGVVHRDLNPRNIMLTASSGRTDVVKLCDFGLSRLVDGRDRVTAVGVVLGTPAYMAPEQLRTGAAQDHRVDLHAFGITAFEMVMGQRPIEAATPAAIIAKKLVADPESTQEVALEGVPAAVEAYIGENHLYGA